MSPSYFYAFADEAAALAAGALVIDETEAVVPAVEGAMIVRTDGIAIEPAVWDAETETVTIPAVLSAPLVILSPVMLPGCSTALVVPCDHAGFA